MSQFLNPDVPSDEETRKGISRLRLLSWFSRGRRLVLLPGWDPLSGPWGVGAAGGKEEASPAVVGWSSAGGAAGWTVRLGAGSATSADVVVAVGGFFG